MASSETNHHDRLTIELVSHCWNYPSPLVYHLSSFILHPPDKVNVIATIWYCREDPLTVRVVDFFSKLSNSLPATVAFCFRELPRERVVRRAIGRNISASETQADYIWFCDVDMCFGPTALDTFAHPNQMQHEQLYYPRNVMRNINHEQGERQLEIARELVETESIAVLPIDLSTFEAARQPRAIGGIQIVSGRIARQHGYLPNSKYQRPAIDWCRTHDDVAYRRALGFGPGSPIDIPDVFRLRHAKQGQSDIGLVL